MTDTGAKPNHPDPQIELQSMQKMFKSELLSFTSHWQWGFSRGRIRVRIRGLVPSGFITAVYVTFNGVCFVAGIALIPVGTIEQTIGVALIVGSIFSFGAFVAQFWAIAVQHEREVAERVFGTDEQIAKLQDMHRRIEELSRAVGSNYTTEDAP